MGSPAPVGSVEAGVVWLGCEAMGIRANRANARYRAGVLGCATAYEGKTRRV